MHERSLRPLVIGFSLLVLLQATGCAHPPEKELVALFQSERDTLEELRQMFEQDRELSCVTRRFYETMANPFEPKYRPGKYLDQARWDVYRKLFRVIGLEGGMCRSPSSPDSRILFAVSNRGFVFAGSYRGIAYSETSPGTVATSLDNRDHDGTIYVALEAHWFLYHADSQ